MSPMVSVTPIFLSPKAKMSRVPRKFLNSNNRLRQYLNVFFYLIGEKERLKGKGIYFVRTTPPGKPVNPNGSNDNEVLFGEISEHTVTSLNVIINNVFKPLVDRLEPVDWGVCEEE
jgi:hypothetical protein